MYICIENVVDSMEMCVWTANEIFLHVIVSFWNGSTSKRTHSTFSVNNCEHWTTGDTQPNLYYKRVLHNNSASLIHMLCDGHMFIIINQAQLLCVAIWLRILPNEDTLTKNVSTKLRNIVYYCNCCDWLLSWRKWGLLLFVWESVSVSVLLICHSSVDTT